MQDLHEVRRRNLRKLIKEAGNASELARRLGMKNSSYLTHVAGPNPTKNIGEKAARDIEDGAGLPRGWLDQNSHDKKTSASQQDEQVFVEVMAQVARIARSNDVKLPPPKLSAVSLLAYEHVAASGSVNTEWITRLVLLMK